MLKWLWLIGNIIVLLGLIWLVPWWLDHYEIGDWRIMPVLGTSMVFFAAWTFSATSNVFIISEHYEHLSNK